VSRAAFALILATAVALTACSGSPQPAPTSKPTAPTPGGVASAPAQTAAAPGPAPAQASAQYSAQGRRDPFETLEVRQGTGPSVAAARLTGIVRSARGPLALVETADGLGYILKPGDTLGDGRLVEIGQGRVVFSITQRAGASSDHVVLNLAGD